MDDPNTKTMSDAAPMEVETTEPTPSVKSEEEETTTTTTKDEERDLNMETSVTVKEEPADSSKEVR